MKSKLSKTQRRLKYHTILIFSSKKIEHTILSLGYEVGVEGKITFERVLMFRILVMCQNRISIK